MNMDDFPLVDPPILRAIDTDSFEIDFLCGQRILEHDFGAFLEHMPLHTQAVERCVQAFSAASKHVCGEKRRNGYVANTMASRNTMPKFDTKKEYEFNNNLLDHLSV